MAKKRHHHLLKRNGIWYFRKGNVRFSLKTTVATEAIKLRDRMLENYILYGQFTFFEDESRVTFGEVTKLWALVHSKRVAHSSWRDYRSTVNLHILPVFKDYPIDEITYLDIETFLATLKCGPKRANNILSLMRSIFKTAFKQSFVKENVMAKVDNLSITDADISPFSHEEVLKILDAVDPFYRPYTAIRFYTGARSAELDGLTWVDFKNDITGKPKLSINKAFVYGRETTTKTKKSRRYIDCLAPVIDALEEQKKLTGKKKYIFLTQDGDRMNPDHYRNVIWTPALKKAGIDYRPPIQTRHTFATLMISAGEDIGWVQAMLGHSSLQMIFRHYYSWIPRKTRSDGKAFMEKIVPIKEEKDPLLPDNTGKVIPLFGKHDPGLSQK